MAFQIRKKTGTEYPPVWLKILEDIPGGGTLNSRRVPSNVDVIKAGALLAESANSCGIYNFIKNGKSIKTQAAATAIALDRNVGQAFVVGEFISKITAGGTKKTTQSTITRISNSTNTVWIATSRALGTLATSSLIFEARAIGSTASLFYATTVLKDNVKVRDADGYTLSNVDCGLVVRGSLMESMCPYPVTTQDKTKLTALIRFETA